MPPLTITDDELATGLGLLSGAVHAVCAPGRNGRT
jgi:hypothetical protein